MKQVIVSMFCIAFAIPCFAQWRDAGFAGYDGSKVLAFGVHDTSLFVGDSGAGRHLVYRWVPPNTWGRADNGMDPSQGNVTSFATLGRYLFAGMTNSRGGPGPGYFTTNNGSSWVQNGGDICVQIAPIFSESEVTESIAQTTPLAAGKKLPLSRPMI